MVRFGSLINAALALTKLVAGILGNSYALVADAIESLNDVFGSLVVWRGLVVAARKPDGDYPFGYARAETLAAMLVGIMMSGAGLIIVIQAVQEIIVPHHAPAPFTLIVLVAVIIIKESLFRALHRVADPSGSGAVYADAWHHRSDAITSFAALVGIAIALLGGEGWESADDYAALAAAVVIFISAAKILRRGWQDLMDRSAPPGVLQAIAEAAIGVSGVIQIEKLRVRTAGTQYRVDLHVQSDPRITLHEAHIISGKVKGAIQRAIPGVMDVLVHMEPFES